MTDAALTQAAREIVQWLLQVEPPDEWEAELERRIAAFGAAQRAAGYEAGLAAGRAERR